MKRILAIGGFKAYSTSAQRMRAQLDLQARGFMYFTYHPVRPTSQHPFGLSFSKTSLTSTTTKPSCWL